MQQLNNPQQQPRNQGGAQMAAAQQQVMREHVDRDQLEMMEENLIQQMAGVDIDEIDDEEYERLQMLLLESMTAQQEIDEAAAANLIEVRGDDEDLPVGVAGLHV